MKRAIRKKIYGRVAERLPPPPSIPLWRERKATGGVPDKWNHVGAAFPEVCDVCHIVGPAHYPFRVHGIFCAEHCLECAEKRIKGQAK